MGFGYYLTLQERGKREMMSRMIKEAIENKEKCHEKKVFVNVEGFSPCTMPCTRGRGRKARQEVLMLIRKELSVGQLIKNLFRWVGNYEKFFVGGR